MQLKYNSKSTYVISYRAKIKLISEISKLLIIKHWLLTLVIIIGLMGYVGYVARNEKLISQHTFIKTETITKDRDTPMFLADLYIHDVSHTLGAEIIRRANGTESINDKFSIGNIVKIPINPNNNKEPN